MPNGVLTILDVIKANSSDILAPLVDEVSRIVPEITGQSIRGVSVPSMGSAKTIDGVNYEILVRTELPSVAFRNANEGTDPTKSQHELRVVQCFSATPKWGVDQVVSDRSKEGLGVLMAREAKAHVQALLQHCCKQFYTGHTNDGKGFTGLKAQYNAADMTVDAGGSTSGDMTSVWGVKFGPEFVQWVYGNNGNFNVKDIRIGDLEDSSGKKFTAYIQEAIAHVGLQMGSKYGVGRIKNLNTVSTHTLNDDMLADLLSKPPSGYEYDCFLMTRRSVAQLQKSRTATNSTGAAAPFPKLAFDVPIIVTDSILDTDSAE